MAVETVKALQKRSQVARRSPAKAPTAFALSSDGDLLMPGQGRLSRWTFLTNHSHVLILLSRDSSLVLREVAWQIGITERAVQRILADLEAAGFVEREKIGRKNHYRIRKMQRLRHPIGSHRTIGDLISLINRR